jgi:hypothetical protein
MGKIDIVYGLLLGAFSLLFFGATMKFPKSSGGIDPRVFPWSSSRRLSPCPCS